MPGAVAVLVGLAGVLNIVSAVTPGMAGRVHELRAFLPGGVTRTATAATAVAGVLLVCLSVALRRRKRRAYQAVVAVLAVSIVLHLVKGFDVEEAAVETALLTVVVLTRGEFAAKPDPTTRWTAVWVGLLLVGLDMAIGLGLLHARTHHIVAPHPLSTQLQEVTLGLVGVSGPLAFTSDRTADVVSAVLLGLGVVTLVVVAYLLLRSPRRQPQLGADDERRIRGLLGIFGDRDSLGYFALRRDKSVIWSATGKSAIAYRVVNAVMLAGGDPIGDHEAWPGAIRAFLAEAAAHAWVPAVLGCSERGGTAYARAGLTVLELGDEAVVEVDEFTLSGRAMRSVRQAVNRVERAGYSCLVRRQHDIPAGELAELGRLVAAWRGSGTERGFSMALDRFGDRCDGGCVTVTCTQSTAAGPVLRALLDFVPWGTDGLSLDLMRRDRSVPDNGLNELLIVSALRAAPALGVSRVSLNFAVLRAAIEQGERLGAGPVQRGWRWVLVLVSRWFQIDTLYRFNAKFRPTWQPRYICYPRGRDLPRIGLAMAEAEAFVVWPWKRHRP